MIQKVLTIIFLLFAISSQASDLSESIISGYENLSRYEDEGTLVRISRKNGESSRKEITFSTKYVRGENFRFYWRELSDLHFNSDGEFDREFTKRMNSILPLSEYYFERKDGESYSSYRGKRNEIEDFCLSYAGATGISQGVAALVPRYLLAKECYEYPHLILPNAKSIGMLGEREIVEITYQHGSTAKLHFNRSSGLLERYESKRMVGEQEVVTAINIIVKLSE